MADAKLTALTAASALAGADLFYVSQSAASRKATGTQLLALVGTAYVPLAGGTMTGALTIASGTLTASAPALNITQTWNDGAVGFKALLVNITNASTSAYATASLLELQTGGVSRFRVDRDGYFQATGFTSSTTSSVNYYGTGLRQGSTAEVAWTSGGISAAADLILYRDAAAQLALRNGTTAQRMHIYGTADAGLTNYQRLVLSANGTTGVTIAAEGLGTPGANQDITLTPGGTGVLRIPTQTSIRTGSASGFVNLDFTSVVLRRGDGANAFGLLAFGGLTSSDPALKRSGALLLARLGDDSADAGFSALYVKTASTTVAGLTAAATAGAGARAFVTDANATTYLSTVAGGGANKVPVVSDGTNWLIG